MTHVLRTELEIDDLSLELELEYDFTPGERMVRYNRDGSGDPGCPPSAELVNATVIRCDLANERRMRRDDTIATEFISRDWDRFENECIEDANDRAERDYDE